MQKKIFVSDILDNAAGVSGKNEPFILEDIRQHMTKQGKPYYRLVLRDKTGTIVAQIWQDYFPFCSLATLQKGDVVQVDFVSESYNDQKTLTIRALAKAEEYNLSDLVASTNKNIDLLYTKLLNYIEAFSNKDLKKLLKDIFTDKQIAEEFRTMPAGERVHHDYIGGLLEHTLEVVEIALGILKHYPEADRDIVVSGALLHDIGKIYDYEFKNFSFRRSKKGYLIGHIVLAVELVNSFLPKDFDEELKLQLIHIILSHHHELEYGAVVRPATIEAAIVAMADYASSQVRQFQKAIVSNKPDDLGFGEYHKILRTKVYFPKGIEKTSSSANEPKKDAAVSSDTLKILKD